ncbi:MAG: phosphohistidine phosphatase, SixA [Acidobacteria bacterium]|nr:phosphohistidine phosphatase, SixA [Acidobacteriota bacterium]
MELYFLRHGLAESRSEWKGDDADRPLTQEGVERMERSAAMIARLGLEPDAILTSPLARARQTALIAAAALKARDTVLLDRRLGPGFDIEQLAAILRDHASARALMLVGHEPSFSETISALIGGGRVVCKKGGLACVDLPDVSNLSGELLWLIPPRLLAVKI